LTLDTESLVSYAGQIWVNQPVIHSQSSEKLLFLPHIILCQSSVTTLQLKGTFDHCGRSVAGCSNFCTELKGTFVTEKMTKGMTKNTLGTCEANFGWQRHQSVVQFVSLLMAMDTKP